MYDFIIWIEEWIPLRRSAEKVERERWKAFTLTRSSSIQNLCTISPILVLDWGFDIVWSQMWEKPPPVGPNFQSKRLIYPRVWGLAKLFNKQTISKNDNSFGILLKNSSLEVFVCFKNKVNKFAYFQKSLRTIEIRLSGASSILYS